jgi:hypothetical protein
VKPRETLLEGPCWPDHLHIVTENAANAHHDDNSK